MKLQCQVEVVNRLHGNLNIRPNGKSLKSTLALGREPKNEKEYFILHFSTVNKTGTKYKVRLIKQVFVKCIHDGKSTIRFGDPPHDLCIKGEAIQLKCFMKLLRQCITGDTKDLKLSCLANISVTAKDIAPTKLTIRDRSEFPSKGFPRTLESLHMSGLGLCNFRRDIILLKHLTILDLSNNEIEKIPPEFGRMPNLAELYLANNRLGAKEDINWEWLLGPQITKSLRLVDLSGNKLKHLPKAIWKLSKLVTLKLDNNLVTRLPPTLGRITSLRYLHISHNRLEMLPCSLKHCHLEHLDISSNEIFHNGSQDHNTAHTANSVKCFSLVKLASQAVLKHKLYYASNIIPWTLVSVLEDADICLCGSPVVNDGDNFYRIILRLPMKLTYGTIVYNHNPVGLHGPTDLVLECHFCSFKCFYPCMTVHRPLFAL